MARGRSAGPSGTRGRGAGRPSRSRGSGGSSAQNWSVHGQSDTTASAPDATPTNTSTTSGAGIKGMNSANRASSESVGVPRMMTRSLMRQQQQQMAAAAGPQRSSTTSAAVYSIGSRRSRAVMEESPHSGTNTHDSSGNRNGAVEDGAPAVVASPTSLGVLRCVCNAFLVGPQETLLQCRQCLNWCHPACVGIDHLELRELLRGASNNNNNNSNSGGGFLCPFCTGEVPLEGGEDGNHFSRRPPAPRQTPLKLRAVPDCRPPEPQASQLESLLAGLTAHARALGFELLHLPDTAITERQAAQCVECCADAIAAATFSPSYPVYCLREVRAARHPYLCGALLRDSAADRIAALVLSNGMDIYGNLKSTVTQLKAAVRRGAAGGEWSPHTQQCIAISDVSDVVHITLSATHRAYQRRGLARLLMTVLLLRWALRGRTRAFLNMAIEKHLDDGGQRVQYAASPASRRLYQSLGFADVFPRYDRDTGRERWTAREADMGRVMANLNFVPFATAAAEALLHAPAEGSPLQQQPHSSSQRQQQQPETSVEGGVKRRGRLPLGRR